MKFLLILISLLHFSLASDISKMLQKQINGTSKWQSVETTIKKTPPPPPKPTPTKIETAPANWWEHSDFNTSKTGDKRIDAILKSLGIRLKFNLKRKKYAGMFKPQGLVYYSNDDDRHYDNSDIYKKDILLKRYSYYSSRDYFVFVLLHEIGHAVGFLQNNRMLRKYDEKRKNYHYKLEEAIADSYAIQMGERLGYDTKKVYDARYGRLDGYLKKMNKKDIIYIEAQAAESMSKTLSMIQWHKK